MRAGLARAPRNRRGVESLPEDATVVLFPAPLPVRPESARHATRSAALPRSREYGTTPSHHRQQTRARKAELSPPPVPVSGLERTRNSRKGPGTRVCIDRQGSSVGDSMNRARTCATAWKHALASHARRSRTRSRTPLLLSQKPSVRTCPPLTLGSLVPSPRTSRQSASSRRRCFARHCGRAARRSQHCRVGRDGAVGRCRGR